MPLEVRTSLDKPHAVPRAQGWFTKRRWEGGPWSSGEESLQKVSGGSPHHGSPTPNAPNNSADDTTNGPAAQVGHALYAAEGFQPVMIPHCTGEGNEVACSRSYARTQQTKTDTKDLDFFFLLLKKGSYVNSGWL